MLSKNLIRLVRQLDTHKGRRRAGLFVAEGPRLVGELLGHFSCVRLVATAEWADTFAQQQRVSPIPDLPAIELVTPEELCRLSLLSTPQQVLAVLRIPEYTFEPERACSQLTLVLDGVQDPGNVGTIVRLADWFGVEDIWCSPQTADVWNPKAVQASMGGLARVRVHYINILSALASLPSHVPVYSTSLQGRVLWDAPLSAEGGVIVMGNEGNGVSPEVAAVCHERLLIPNYPEGRLSTESLNVAMATGIVLAEFRRRAVSSLHS